MKNKIEIKGITLISLKKALKKWIDEYSDSFNSKLQFEIYNVGRNHQIVIINNELQSEHFFFLINYLEFLDNIEYEVKGNIKPTNVDSILNNQKLLVYISKSDTEFDNVYAVNEENKTYKIDFAGKITEISFIEKYSEIIEKEKPISQIIKFNPEKKKESKKETCISRIKKRFKILFIIFISMNCVYFLLPFFTLKHSIIFNGTISVSLLTLMWFLIDEKMLQLSKFYLKSLLISIFFIGFSELFRYIHSYTFTELPSLFFFLPFSFLIVQLPVRLFYKKIFNREPKIDRYGKFTDLVYTLILSLFPILISGMIYEYLK